LRAVHPHTMMEPPKASVWAIPLSSVRRQMGA
jgi:hypothetical protein